MCKPREIIICIFWWKTMHLEIKKNDLSNYSYDTKKWHPSTVLCCKTAFLKWAWQKVNVLPRPRTGFFHSGWIWPLKWGTLHLWTPTGSKMASRQSWKIIKTFLLLLELTVILIVQLWWLAILEPVEVQRRNVPHFKGLINLKWKGARTRMWQHIYLMTRSFKNGRFTT